MTPTRTKCIMNLDGSVCLMDILNSFNYPIREEHAWALCYQFIKFFSEKGRHCCGISNADQVFLQTDGNIHIKTLYEKDSDNILRRVCTEREFISGLGLVIYSTLDRDCANNEERFIGHDLEQLINDMISDELTIHHRTDDEGSNGDLFCSKTTSSCLTLAQVKNRCEDHLSTLSKSQAESHYKAVVRALVAEAIELTTFLEKVAEGKYSLVEGIGIRDLERLQFTDWARLWMQVIQELRSGIKLKKVHHRKAPIEYELTPYEILMKDICSYNRCSLRKIIINGNMPSRVTKDAHAVILEFIRSRPPLRKASERKLAPYRRVLTPREQLMLSIRKGRALKKTHTNRTSLSPTMEKIVTGGSVRNPKKLIKVDFLQLQEDDVEEVSDTSDGGSLWLEEEYHQLCGSNLEPYDLAMEYPETKNVSKRYSLTVSAEQQFESQSVPQSRPCSRQSCASSETESVQLTPEIAQALHNNTKPWHETISLHDRLSLTLEEIVHIRTVLTKAEVEALPIEGHIKSDVENRKVCFLCLKTRFGILGPWGQRCILCKRTVCTKCCSKMYIPVEHFSSVPVVLLSPSIMASPEDGNLDLFPRTTPHSEASTSTASSRQSSPSRRSSSMENLRRHNLAYRGCGMDKIRTSQMIVCHDCKMMVLQIIKSAQVNRSAIRNKHLQNLTLNLSPVF